MHFPHNSHGFSFSTGCGNEQCFVIDVMEPCWRRLLGLFGEVDFKNTHLKSKNIGNLERGAYMSSMSHLV